MKPMHYSTTLKYIYFAFRSCVGVVPMCVMFERIDIRMTSLNTSPSLFVGNSPVTGEFPHKGQWRGALMLSLICAWINGWVNNREAADLRCHRANYDITLMCCKWMEYVEYNVQDSKIYRNAIFCQYWKLKFDTYAMPHRGSMHYFRKKLYTISSVVRQWHVAFV